LELCGILSSFEEKEEVRVGNTDTVLLLDVCKYKTKGKSQQKCKAIPLQAWTGLRVPGG
jgi:hypothetical protein